MTRGNRWFTPADFTGEHRLILRLLALRRSGRIGVVFVDSGNFYIAEDDLDPWNTRRHYTVAQLTAIADELEARTPFQAGRAGESEVEARRRIA